MVVIIIRRRLLVRGVEDRQFRLKQHRNETLTKSMRSVDLRRSGVSYDYGRSEEKGPMSDRTAVERKRLTWT